MSSIVDDEFAEKIFMFLPGFKRTGAGLEFKLNARCPVCDDKTSPRFWYYSNNKLMVCYNCGLRSRVKWFIEDHKPELYSEYLFETRKQFAGINKMKRSDELEVFNSKREEIPKIPRLEYSTRLDKLPSEHPIIKYVSNRKIPKEEWPRLWFTREWKRLANTIKAGTYSEHSLVHKEPRLVIPIFNSDSEIESIQGRDLTGKSKNKYMTIKSHENSTKIYGTDLVIPSMRVWVLEGPLDSLFIKNSIAITGGEVSLDVMPYPGNRTWVMDNEPRSPDTIKRMERLLSLGESIVIFDRSPWASKDINDMVAKEGADPKDIINYFRENTVSGLNANLRMSRWKKV